MRHVNIINQGIFPEPTMVSISVKVSKDITESKIKQDQSASVPINTKKDQRRHLLSENIGINRIQKTNCMYNTENFVENAVSKTSTIKVMHQNIQCIRNKLLHLEIMLTDNPAKISCLTEHWQNPLQKDIRKIEEYNDGSTFYRKEFFDISKKRHCRRGNS